MKIHVNPKELINGYTNVFGGPINAPDAASYDIAYDTPMLSSATVNSIDEIVIGGFINEFDPSKITEYLSRYRDVLKTDGLLRFSIIDIEYVAYLITNGQLNIEQAHQMIMGDTTPYKMIMNVHSMRKIAEKLGFAIMSIYPDKQKVEFVLCKMN